MPDKEFLQREKEAREMLQSVPPDVIGARLARARKRQGLSIRDLAAAANVDKSSIVRIEAGAPPQTLTVMKLCAALGIHLATIAANVAETGAVAVHKREDDVWYDMSDLAAGPLPEENRSGIAAPMVILKSRLEGGILLSNIIELNGECPGQSVPGEEMVFVIRGILRLTVGAQTMDLEEGESATFWSSERHCYAPAPGSPLPVRLLCVSAHRKPQ
jgi:transcriptional regulator with XRE-family HTH domain